MSSHYDNLTYCLKDMYFMGCLIHGEPQPPPHLPPPGLQLSQHLAQLANQIEEAQTMGNVRHPPISVARAINPFEGNPALQAHFVQFSSTINLIPAGYDLDDAAAWDEEETLRVGAHDTHIVLPTNVWRPRALEWVRGLEAMILFQRYI